MAMTATQKILAAHAGLDSVHAGQLIAADVDLVLSNDITAPVAINQFEKLGMSLFDKDKIVIVLDHFTPNKDIKSAEQCKTARNFAAKHNITHFYDVGEMGIEHALLPEKGLVRPMSLIIGADSHTCTYGALTCFSTGVGSTDAAVAMATGKVWLKVPSAVKIIVRGHLRKYVSGKDVILTIIKKLGVDGATYKSLEFFGDIENLSIDDRFTIANMAVECGAKNAVFPFDDITKNYLIGKIDAATDTLYADDDADYDATIEINLDDLSPVVAFPHLPSNVKNVDEIDTVEIQQAVIGSCTNGRLSDLKAAAEILSGRKIKKGVRCIIIPATQSIYLSAIKLGYIQTFIEAGAAVSTPACGCCLGGHTGVLAAGEKCVATTNRNFVGRMGHPDSEIYLASPAVAAASAVTGRISNPQEVMKDEYRR